MFDELKNLNIDLCSGPELETLIRRTLPTVMTFIKASQRLLNEDKPAPKPCDNCNKYNACKKPCELLENILPKIHKGPQNLKRTYGNLINEISDTSTKDIDSDEILHKFDINYLKAIDRVRADDIFVLYKNCIQLFSKKEWRVITLKLDEGLTYKTIGQILGISTSTASDTFQRAKRRMESHYQKK